MSTPVPQIYINIACADLPASIKFYEGLGFRASKVMSDSNATSMHYGPWLNPDDELPTTVLNVVLLKRTFFKSFLPAETGGENPKDASGGLELARVGNGTHKLTTDVRNNCSALYCLKVDSKTEADSLVDAAVKMGGKADPSNLFSVPGMYGRGFEDLDGYVWELMVWDHSEKWDLPEDQRPAKVQS